MTEYPIPTDSERFYLFFTDGRGPQRLPWDVLLTKRNLPQFAGARVRGCCAWLQGKEAPETCTEDFPIPEPCPEDGLTLETRAAIVRFDRDGFMEEFMRSTGWEMTQHEQELVFFDFLPRQLARQLGRRPIRYPKRRTRGTIIRPERRFVAWLERLALVARIRRDNAQRGVHHVRFLVRDRPRSQRT